MKTVLNPSPFLLVATVIIFGAAIGAVWLYVDTFGTSLSTKSTRWAEFGSFIGGIFGPLISFFALIALLITVYLQKQLLKAQSKEAEKNHTNQLQQLETAQAALLSTEINNTKSHMMKAIIELINITKADVKDLQIKLEKTVSEDAANTAADELIRNQKGVYYLTAEYIKFAAENHKNHEVLHADLVRIIEGLNKLTINPPPSF